MHWPKDKSPLDWQELVEHLDPSQDVLLYPSSDSIFVEQFDWHHEEVKSNKGIIKTDAIEDTQKRWRLIVLEGSWNYSKYMAESINKRRRDLDLPPIKCVMLNCNTVGKYWRFHEEGHSAVSTIEAIAHTATAAGLKEYEVTSLLLLFNYQKAQVFRNMLAENQRVPKAVSVDGFGQCSWKPFTDSLNNIDELVH